MGDIILPAPRAAWWTGLGIRRKAALLAALSISWPAHAWEFKEGDWSGGIRAVVTVGTAIRASPIDPSLVPAGDGAGLRLDHAAPGGVNSDDGNLNYRRGDPVSSVAKGLVEFEANNADGWGVFTRVKGWYDHTLAEGHVALGNLPNDYAGGPLSDRGFSQGAKFRGISLADAYVKGQFSAGGLPVSVKAGQQTVDWGPAFTIPGGLRDINPRDFAALSRPGLQPQEGAKPFLALSGKIDLSSAASLEIFYQLLSATSTQPGCGTFAATADYASPGCDRVMVSNALSSADGLATGRFLKRGSDGTAGDAGQFGIGGSYLVPDIGTRFSLHFTNVHARTGYVEADRTGRSGAIFLPGDPDGLNPAYRFQYPKNIRMLSGSFATSVPSMKLRIAGELDHKFNQPLAFNAPDLLQAAVSGTGVLARDFALVPLGGPFAGYERFHVTQGQFAASGDIGSVIGGTLTLGGEVGAKYVHDLPDPNFRRYGRSDIFGTGPNNGVCAAGADPKACTTKGFVTPFSWGYRLQASLSYRDILPEVTLKPSVAFAHDVNGTSYDGAFNQGRQILRLALDGTVKDSYLFNLTYQTTLAGPYDPRADRDVFLISTGVKL
ncbi:hypothetical protein CRT60_02685 [Azospirillum palustre]|uniref:DUF1302 domain-containing protein n=1 Tax=Azospirillum palustre TaxID=2044885 RepID=A0A2B8BMG6_9PROT|nr:DUF1302 family protein [Azospirillum palustre]PGH58919.1 hypothetical protein CRT60_02685 [Azospirillum palustre]